MIDDSFEEIFNDDLTLQNEYSQQLTENSEIGEEFGIDSDKEVIMFDPKDSGGIFDNNQDDLDNVVKNMQNELLSRKQMPPVRITDIESKLKFNKTEQKVKQKLKH